VRFFGLPRPRRLAEALTLMTMSLGWAIFCRAEVVHPDPWFAKLPFEKWLAEREHGDLRWSADILPAEISMHQRLMLRVVIRLSGRVLEKHRGAGEFLPLVQYKDSAGRIWQHHTSLDVANLAPGTGTRQLAIAQYAFVLPGDYSLAIAVCDTATLEHGLILRHVRAAPLEADPLPNAWAGLPAVDFLPPVTEPPDVWYLPGVEGHLNLPLATKRPVHLHVLLNITPSWQSAGSIAALRSYMNALTPILKVLSQIELPNGTRETALLDLTHLRVAFEQNNSESLDWERMRKVFLDAQPGIVDVRTLGERRKMRAFFRNEVVRRLKGGRESGDAAEIVIVLSGPAFLPEQDADDPVTLPGDPNHGVYYLRYHGVPAPPEDDLERAAAQLKGRVYDAASPERVREILASVLDEIARL
jgi:hypothetical protein